jgi:hypothetical protein
VLWINFLHLYQPANADGHVIKEATEKSYLRLIRGLEEHTQIKFTMNINGCLLMRWEEMNYFDLFKRLGALIKRGQLEITGNAAYHPLLPLIKPEEIANQVKETEFLLAKYLGEMIGKDFKPKGFFASEMAYSPEAAVMIKRLGYEWLILDEISYVGKLKDADKNRIFNDKASGLKIILRDRKLSASYVPDTLRVIIDSEQPGSDKTFITATDGELYGLRHEDPTAEFEKILNRPEINTALISEYIAEKEAVPADFRSSNWEASEKDLAARRPYNLWQDERNVIQRKLWELANLAYVTVENYRLDANYSWARWHLVRGLASCTFWWASGRHFKLFAPIQWSPDDIERGINELIRSIRALDDVSTREIKIKAEKLHIKIKQMIWEQHWAYYWKRKS